MKILIIDDDETTRLIMRKILNNAGHEVLEAVNGKIGIALYNQSPVDIVITDIYMPEKDGIEVIAELKQKFQNAKVIAMSGGTGRDMPEDLLLSAKLLGADSILSKPIKSQELINVVYRLGKT